MLTYRELGQRIATAIANLQNRGVQPGNVVALYLPRSPEQIILSLACALQGVIWYLSISTRRRNALPTCWKTADRRWWCTAAIWRRPLA